MKIEQAKITDAEEIIEINIQEWKNTYQGIFPSSFLNDLETKKETSIEKCINKISEYVVCKINNQVVGFLRYGKNKKGYPNEYGEIYALYVSHEFQKQGIGASLINYATKIMKENYQYILISTLVQNSANSFYQKIGGKLIGTSTFVLEEKEFLENVYQFDISKRKY